MNQKTTAYRQQKMVHTLGATSKVAWNGLSRVFFLWLKVNSSAVMLAIFIRDLSLNVVPGLAIQHSAIPCTVI